MYGVQIPQPGVYGTTSLLSRHQTFGCKFCSWRQLYMLVLAALLAALVGWTNTQEAASPSSVAAVGIAGTQPEDQEKKSLDRHAQYV